MPRNDSDGKRIRFLIRRIKIRSTGKIVLLSKKENENLNVLPWITAEEFHPGETAVPKHELITAAAKKVI